MTMNRNLWALLFGHRTDVEYLIPIKDIVITYDFQLKSPHPKKFWRKVYNFKKYGILGKIKLNKDFELVDGYCSYLIYKMNDIDKVPVWFVN